MYRHILLAVALQHWDELSPHAVAAREAAVTLAHGSGAQLTVLSVYDYGDETPEALSFSPEALSLSSVDLARYQDTQMQRMDELMTTKMQAFLAGVPLPAIGAKRRPDHLHRMQALGTGEELSVHIATVE
jgi:nucleotide-binding universal stress UspA family protein